MNDKERIKHIQEQIRKEDDCKLLATMDKPFSKNGKITQIDQFKSFKIHRHTARKLIKMISISQGEGYSSGGVERLADELKSWVKQ